MIRFLKWICKFNFGDFEIDEFRKFIRMGFIFFIIIGVYWSLRPLKDSVFIQLVDRVQLPYAKTFSLLGLIPVVMFYTKILEKISKEKMFIVLTLFYGISIFIFACLMLVIQAPHNVIEARAFYPYVGTKIVGYLFYLFVESYGSIFIASLFWAFASSVTEPISAKRGFPLIYTFGQIGGMFFPYSIVGLPHRIGFKTDALSLFCLAFLVVLIIPLFHYFLKHTPRELLSAFHGKNELEEEKQQEPGFLEGLKLLLQHKYLLGIFAVNFIYEFLVTIFDFNFKMAAGGVYSGVALSDYLGLYGSGVNTVSLLCLLLGISNVTRFLGVGIALAIMPIIFVCALLGFLTINSLTFLFILMVGAKAINYALNGPALKQLYIPTTPDVRFKAQAWVETFGSRTSKETGSIFNMTLAPLQAFLGNSIGYSRYILLSGLLGFPMLFMWLLIALYLGKTFRRAVKNKNVVC
jgi:AAA family ATP:ADP antiporter